MKRDFLLALAVVSALGIAASAAFLALVIALNVPLTRGVWAEIAAPAVVAVAAFTIAAPIEAAWRARK